MRQDVAAERPPDLVEVGVGLHIQKGAVGGQAGAEARGHARCQRAANRRAADQHGRGFAAVDEVFENRRVGLDAEVLQLRVVVDRDRVDAVMPQLFGQSGKAVSGQQRVDRLSDLAGQFAGFADQFQGDRMDLTFGLVDIDRDAAPRTLVDRHPSAVNEFKSSGRALLDTELAHAARRRDADAVRVDLDGAERA
jgi:hypothetical protein